MKSIARLKTKFGNILTNEKCGDLDHVSLHALRTQTDTVRNKLTENIRNVINKVVERGDDLIDLQRRSEALNNNPVEFQRPATKLKLHSGRPCIQFITVLLASVLVMIVIIMIINNVQ